MSKRRIWPMIAGVTVLGLAACAPASGESDGDPAGYSVEQNHPEGEIAGEVRVYVGGDTNVAEIWTDVIVPEFSAQYPDVTVDLTHDLHSENSSATLARIAAATETGDDPSYDLLTEIVEDAGEADLLVSVDSEDVPLLATVPQDLIDAGQGFAIPYRGSSVLLAYDSEVVEDPPDTLPDVLDWIRDNPGRFAYNSPGTGGSGSAFVGSVLDLYVESEHREEMTYDHIPEHEQEWDEGFAELADLGQYVYQEGVYPNGNNQVLELLASGQIDMAPVWSDQFLTARSTGQIADEVLVQQISDPPFTGGAAYLGVPTASPNQAAALALANFTLEPQMQEAFTTEMFGYPAVALEEMPQEVQDEFVEADPDVLRPGYHSDHSASLNERWDAEVPGQ